MNKFLFNLYSVAIIPIVLWIIMVPVYNYFFDPYGLLTKPHHQYKTEPNLRSLKREFVANEDADYTFLLFSNSRGGVYQIDNDGFYNMSYSLGLPEEFLADIKYLLQKDKVLDSVVLFLDETSIYINYKDHQNQPLRKVFNTNDYTSILSIPFDFQKFSQIIRFNDNKYKSVQFYVDTDGHYEFVGFNDICDSFNTIKLQTITSERKAETIRAERAWIELINFLKKNDIGYSIFIHPLSDVRIKSSPYIIADLMNLITSLQLKGIVFQNTLSIIQNSASCFYDDSHYSHKIAQTVIVDFEGAREVVREID